MTHRHRRIKLDDYVWEVVVSGFIRQNSPTSTDMNFAKEETLKCLKRYIAEPFESNIIAEKFGGVYAHSNKKYSNCDCKTNDSPNSDFNIRCQFKYSSNLTRKKRASRYTSKYIISRGKNAEYSSIIFIPWIKQILEYYCCSKNKEYYLRYKNIFSLPYKKINDCYGGCERTLELKFNFKLKDLQCSAKEYKVDDGYFFQCGLIGIPKSYFYQQANCMFS